MLKLENRKNISLSDSVINLDQYVFLNFTYSLTALQNHRLKIWIKIFYKKIITVEIQRRMKNTGGRLVTGVRWRYVVVIWWVTSATWTTCAGSLSRSLRKPSRSCMMRSETQRRRIDTSWLGPVRPSFVKRPSMHYLHSLGPNLLVSSPPHLITP